MERPFKTCEVPAGHLQCLLSHYRDVGESSLLTVTQVEAKTHLKDPTEIRVRL